MITLADYCTRKGQDLRQPYADEWTDERARHAHRLLNRVNIVLTVFYHRNPTAVRQVTSGWRPQAVNAAVGGAPRSCHIEAQAVDLADADGRLKAFLQTTFGEKLLRLNELWCEDFADTPTHVHLQTVRPASGERFFARGRE